MTAMTCVRHAPMIRHREIGHSENTEILEITSPTAFVTRAAAA